ncbi:MAG: RloB domain-containing protein [Candidatus Delongbacteria bacterium]|nr:RloB domain-containing protein [Candidatus Delongbacteria bacterium]
MARVKKIDNAIKKRIAQKQRRQERAFNTRNVRKKYLIVCEGERTEPNYFTSLKKKLPKGVVEIDIEGTGANTLSLVDIAIRLKKEQAEKAKRSTIHRPYDHVWVVFDKDDFPDVNFDNAIFRARSSKIKVAYTNEAFELWYLLHFQFHNTGISRHQYYPLLTGYIDREYAKNSEDMYELLAEIGNEKNAIKWANALLKNSNLQNPASSNPSTTVHRLIEELNKYKPE